MIRNKNKAEQKGRIQMFGQSKIMTTLLAAVGSLLLSSVAVSAAVAPAMVTFDQAGVSTYA